MVVVSGVDGVFADAARPPAGTAEFVGRVAELHRLNALIDDGARLITLVGPGGIGKTRLVAELLRRMGHHRKSVHWARLAEIERDAAGDDVGAVQCMVRTSAAGASEPTAGHRILVLDNCEHMLPAVARVVAELIPAAPDLIILATSREPIGWIDEYVLTVPPLSPGQSLELFRRRSELTGRPILDDPGQIDIAAQICRHVDHSPLFVRLAAARLRHQPPVMVLRELTGDAGDKRMRWSHGARAGVEQRHRGVYDVIEWSYRLCTAEEQVLLERLSVFAAGYETDRENTVRNGIELADAVAVCAGDSLSAHDIEDLIERLAERSLVSTHVTTTSVRWYLVESVKVFARDRLQSRGEDESARMADRHRRYYRDRVIAWQADWFGPREQAWLDWVRAAWDNIVVGIEAGLDDPVDALAGLETAAVLLATWVPSMRGDGSAITWVTERALEATRTVRNDGAETRLRASAMLAWNAVWQGDSDRAARLLDECVAGAGVTGNSSWRDTPSADIGLPAYVEWAWGLELMLAHRDGRAMLVLERARRKFAESGDQIGCEGSSLFHALACAFLGDGDTALRTSRDYLGKALPSGSPSAIVWAQITRAVALAGHGGAIEAVAITERLLAELRQCNDAWITHWAEVARIVAMTQLLAGHRTDEECRGTNTSAAAEIRALVADLEQADPSAGVRIGAVPLVAFEMRRATEVANRFVEASALGGAERLGPGMVSRAPNWDSLSRAEREIAVLAAAGWSNNAIAVRRGSSMRTVDAQVASIRQKLAIASRREIVSHIPADLADRIELESRSWAELRRH
ncbi:ATP-binding protein [Nocardia sp. NPDC059180]|uniref:ATP-binding protein n=1 Tax=Nocardia sp. NPDC059180 TaxID=3346761 RepID=UPI0036CE642C